MLSPVEALHTAARHYCIERIDLHEAHAPSVGRRSWGVWHEIQAAVEALTPADLSLAAEARERLLSAGANAFMNDRTGRPRDPVARQALKDFAEYVQGVSYAELAHVEPLPFRRALSESESEQLWGELETRWGIKGMSYPFDHQSRDEPPPNTQVFEDDPFFDQDVQHRLRRALAGLGVSRLWELQERRFLRDARFADGVDGQTVRWGRDYEIDRELLEPVYDETFWTNISFDWLIYKSHEYTVTISGAELLRAVQQSWPQWRGFIWPWSHAPEPMP
jgi:hypothetical protein